MEEFFEHSATDLTAQRKVLVKSRRGRDTREDWNTMLEAATDMVTKLFAPYNLPPPPSLAETTPVTVASNSSFKSVKLLVDKPSGGSAGKGAPSRLEQVPSVDKSQQPKLDTERPRSLTAADKDRIRLELSNVVDIVNMCACGEIIKTRETDMILETCQLAVKSMQERQCNGSSLFHNHRAI